MPRTRRNTISKRTASQKRRRAQQRRTNRRVALKQRRSIRRRGQCGGDGDGTTTEIKEGYLQRKGTFSLPGHTTKRYVVIETKGKFKTPYMKRYVNDDRKVHRGTDEQISDVIRLPSSNNSFQIQTPNSNHTLTAESETERNEWIDKIESALDNERKLRADDEARMRELPE